MSKARLGWRIAAGLLTGLLILVAGAAIWLSTYDWNGARGWVARAVEARTGRALAIEGPLTVQPFSRHPRIRAENVTFANVEWGEKEPMFSAGLLDLRLDLWHLLYGRFVITELVLENATALLERDAQGRRNWILKPPGEEHKGRSPEILQLQIRDSRVRVKDAASNTDVSARIQSQPNEKTWGMKISATGRVRGVPFKLSGDSGGLLQIMDEHKPYPIRLAGTLGKSKASAQGTLTGVATLQDVDVDMTLSGDNMAPLGEVLKLSLPHTKPYSLAGRLERRGPEWKFRDTRGKVGASDLAGDFTVRTDGERPLLTANLQSKNLDIADLGGFVGTRPGATEATHAPGKVLPSEPINVEKLNRIDAKVRLTAGHFQNADKFPLDNLDATLAMRDGVLTLEPVNFGVADGKVSTSVRVDARAKQLKTRLDTAFTNLLISRLVPGTQKIDQSFGAVDGRLRLAGTGNSPAAMLGSASGRLDLHSNGGSMSKLMLKIASVQVLDIVRYMIGGDEQAQLRCAVMSFKMDKGVAKSDVIVIDTDDTVIGGAGTVNLHDETLDLSLVPLPKDPSPLQLRGPLYVRGPFVKPDYGIDKKTLARKLGSSVLLGLLNPLAAIVPLIETGPGKDAPCGQLIATVEAAAGGKKTASTDKPRGG
ncbi:MAG TPA: AsmA family protein [Burkholderiales bacterium]|nr:AsmA family protein [Burkholderiales bacterium]